MAGLLKISKRNLSSFSHSKRGTFFQEAPKLTNQYDEDTFMQDQLKIEIPKEVTRNLRVGKKGAV
jgi:hypothetical protein